MRLALAFAAVAFAAAATADVPVEPRGEAPFVVTYRCDGDQHIAVGYPSYRDARTAPIRISWEGRTLLLMPARAGSGARYANAIAGIEWWSKGNRGTLSRLRDNRPLLTGCSEI